MQVLRKVAPLFALLSVALPAHAEQYWTNEKLLLDFFKPEKVTYKSVTLSDADAAEIGKKLGAPLAKKTWAVYLDEVGEHKRTGYAVLDQEVGLHEFIDYGVRFDLAGAVRRLEIRTYREPYGDEVRSERFRSKFVGKTANDPFVAGKDIDIISGATYSSRALALGVKRDALIVQAALKSGSL
jgi:hypothetical protein